MTVCIEYNVKGGIDIMKKRIPYVLAIITVLLGTYTIYSQIKWYDFNSGFAAVKNSKKPAVIDFYADWCIWCKTMDKETFSNPAVEKKLNRDYIAIRINVEKNDSITFENKTYSAQEFAAYCGVEGLPTLVFMDKEGKLVTRIPGYIKAEVFLSLLDYMKDECYKKKVSFHEYMQQKDCGK